MRRSPSLGALLVGLALVVACGGRSTASATTGSGSSSGATGGNATGASTAIQSLTVKGTDQFRFEPTPLAARANGPIHLALDDGDDALVHDFVIDNVGGKDVKIEAQPHSRASGDFALPAGSYQFYCSQPGHKEAGMVGIIVAS